MFYEDEKRRLDGQFHTHTTVDDKGVVRWISNNAVPPLDILELWRDLNKPFNFQESSEVMLEDTKNFLEAYRKARENTPLTDEERYEMRAAFGEGVEVVNIVTGQRFRS